MLWLRKGGFWGIVRGFMEVFEEELKCGCEDLLEGVLGFMLEWIVFCIVLDI